MRIKELELSWFRGASESVKVTILGKSAVIYGANGAGKSSFVDAIEFLLSSGKIRHLAHEYSGKKQIKGIRNTHAPENSPGVVKLTFDSGGSITGTINPRGVYSLSSIGSVGNSELDKWRDAHVLLRQDEMSSFISMTKSDKYTELYPLLGLAGSENTANSVKKLRQAIEKRTGISGLRATYKDRKKDATRMFGSATEEAAWPKLVEISKKYSVPSKIKFLKVAQSVDNKLTELIEASAPAERRYALLAKATELNLNDRIKNLETARTQAIKKLTTNIGKRIEVLEASEVLVSRVVKRPAKRIHCPACGKLINAKDLRGHIKKDLKFLVEAKNLQSQISKHERNVISGLQTAADIFKSPELVKWLKLKKNADLKKSITKIIRLIESDEANHWTKSFRTSLAKFIPIIENGVRQETLHAPSEIRHLIQDKKTIETALTIPEFEKMEKEGKRISNVLRLLEDLETGIRERTVEKTTQSITQVSDRIQELWAKLHPDEPIEEVKLYVPEDQKRSLDISLKFFGIDQPSPRISLSEGHRNSLGLCVFLALALMSQDDVPIILDDIVTSIDRDHRSAIVELFGDYLGSRQVILLTHEREWYSELTYRLPRKAWSFEVLKPWVNPVLGIQWSASKETFDDARQIAEIRPESAGNTVRSIMDTNLSLITETLKVDVEHRRGNRNDQRTCIEFLERVGFEAKTKFKTKEIDKEEWTVSDIARLKLQEAKDLLVSWGNRSSHGGSLTVGEVEKLIEASEAALDVFRCPDCDAPVWSSIVAGGERFQCKCSKYRWDF